jgi:mannose-6-phosphate isomerase-like protein (cupin superfamily)
MTSGGINFNEKFAKFSERWAPKVIATMNDYEFKLVKIEGDFVWHNHEDTDEVFIVLEGSMRIDFKDFDVEHVDLKEGEMFVVPKKVFHRPVAEKECKVLLVEPRGVVNTGDKEEDGLRAPNEVWI